eukprot:2335829-Rhodomonas_salina.2
MPTGACCQYWHICLRACYGKPGTDPAYGATRDGLEMLAELEGEEEMAGGVRDLFRTVLRVCYAVSGTASGSIVLQMSYAMSGMDLVRSVVLMWAMLLPAVARGRGGPECGDAGAY